MRFMSYHLKRSDASVQDGVRRIAVSQINAALAELHDEALDVHETVHQVRKRCKKLRGLIRLVRPAFADYKKENAVLRGAAAQLSHVRDAQAMIETYDYVVQVYDDTVERQTFEPIRRRLTQRKKRIAKEKGLDDKLSNFRGTMVETRDRAARWTLDDEGFGAVGGGLAKTYKRGVKALARARDEPTADNLHELRKRVKYHWYHARILRSIWPDIVGAHRDVADRLADLLGEHHNLAVFRPMLLADPEAFGNSKDVEAFIGLIERRQAALAADAFAIGIRFFAEEASAFRRRWEAYWHAWRDEKALRKAYLAR
jgi:CHAD domain-containing protein